MQYVFSVPVPAIALSVPALPVSAVRLNVFMAAGPAPESRARDPGIESLLAEFKAEPSLSLGDFPALDESFLRQSGMHTARTAAFRNAALSCGQATTSTLA